MTEFFDPARLEAVRALKAGNKTYQEIADELGLTFYQVKFTLDRDMNRTEGWQFISDFPLGDMLWDVWHPVAVKHGYGFWQQIPESAVPYDVIDAARDAGLVVTTLHFTGRPGAADRKAVLLAKLTKAARGKNFRVPVRDAA